MIFSTAIVQFHDGTHIDAGVGNYRRGVDSNLEAVLADDK
jgi:hypothetical protein